MYLPWAGILWLILVALLHIWFAIGVLSDAWEVQKERPKTGPELVGPIAWALATLVGGVFAAAVYWLVNRSTFHPGVKQSGEDIRR